MSETSNIRIPVVSWDANGKCYVGYTYQQDSTGNAPSVIIDMSLPLANNPGLNPEFAKDIIDKSINSTATILGAAGKGVEIVPGMATLAIVTTPINVLYDIQYKNESVAQALVSQGLAAATAFALTYGTAWATVALGFSGVGLPAAITLSAASTYLSYELGQRVDKYVDENWGEFSSTFQNFTRLWPNGDPYGYMIPPEFMYLMNQAYTTASPLVLDLDGDGIETISVNNSNVMFDLDADGRRNVTGWLNGDDGFLIMDRDGDGLVDDGGEMFGNSTAKYDGTGVARDGFAALAQEDSNGDGVVNILDANWGNLRIWRDVNQDGISQADELFTMDEAGIRSIDVNYMAGQSSQNGNTLYGTGSYTNAEGDSHYMTDAWFEQDTFNSEHTNNNGHSNTVEIPDDMAGLPNMHGSGAVRDLLEAAAEAEAKNPESQLKEFLEQYSAGTRAEQMALLDDLLYAWANTSEMYTSMEERCAGIFNVKHDNLPGGDVEAWSRKLHILEAFNGSYFFANLPGGGTPFNPNDSYHRNLSVSTPNGSTIPTLTINWGNNQMARLNEAYDLLLETVYNTLLMQTRLAPAMDLIDLNIDMESLEIGLDFTRLTQYFTEKMASDPVNGISDLMDFNRSTQDMLSGSGWNGYDLAYGALQGMDLTPSLKECLQSLKVNMFGVEGYNPKGSTGNDFIFGWSGNDTLDSVVNRF